MRALSLKYSHENIIGAPKLVLDVGLWLLLDIAFHIFIALPTITKVVVVALSRA